MCLSAHIFIYFSSSRAVSGRQMSCSQEKKNNLRWKKKKRRGGEVEGKIYEYANLVTVWNLVMSGKCCRHLSLCRGHCLMPGSWAQLLLSAPPPPHPPNLSCHLTATWTKLQPGTKQHRGHGHTHAHAHAVEHISVHKNTCISVLLKETRGASVLLTLFVTSLKGLG